MFVFHLLLALLLPLYHFRVGDADGKVQLGKLRHSCDVVVIEASPGAWDGVLVGAAPPHGGHL